MKYLYFLVLLFCLQGCSFFKPVLVMERPTLSQERDFVLNGRIAVRYQDKHHSAGMRWTHLKQTDEVLLLAPLGQTAARIYSDSNLAELDDGKKKHQAPNVESLMQQTLGWNLPISDLHRWVLGLPSTEQAEKLQRNELGQLDSMQQNGWEIRYVRYADDKPDSLPVNLQLRRDDLQIKLVIDSWEWMP